MGSLPRPQINVQELAFQSTVKRGLDLAQRQIVRIRGRKPPFSGVRIGRTDVTLDSASQTRQGYAVTSVFSSSNVRAIEEIEKHLANWLKACPDKRFEHNREALVKAGTGTVYLAVR